MHVKAEPHTRTLDTTDPFSAFIMIKYPSTEPATRAVPNGWKVSDTHSYVICMYKIVIQNNILALTQTAFKILIFFKNEQIKSSIFMYT